MTVATLDGIPVELTPAGDEQQASTSPAAAAQDTRTDLEAKIIAFVNSWRDKLRTARVAKRAIWDECWALYRGLDDFRNKEDWQSKIVLPKAFGSVKQATNVIKRLLSTAKNPWQVEAINPDDLVATLRAEQMTDLSKVLLDQARYQEEFAEGLECGFVIGLGVWKVWWALVPRVRTRVEVAQVPVAQPPAMPGMQAASSEHSIADLLAGAPASRQATGILGQLGTEYPAQENDLYPTQLPTEALSPLGWGQGEGLAAFGTPQPRFATERRIVREEILEGRLMIRAVDPYNFYWLPGSKMNRWAGTIEEIEVPLWQLHELAEQGVLDAERLKGLAPMQLDEYDRKAQLRFNEPPQPNSNDVDGMGNVKLTEYYGPLILDGKLVDKHAHVLIANGTKCLLPGGYQANRLWCKKAPYIGFSPLALPFRTEGVGLVEMVRKIDKALSQLANLSVDTLMFRLLPVFEINLDAFDNPKDFETGLTPGKLFKRNMNFVGEGIKPIEFQDISAGAVQVSAALDREHQAGSLVSEIQQAIPRYRGVQSATEIQEKSENQDSFFGNMASDIEKQALEPMIELAVDLILQFIDTANDPRVASILGVGADALKGLTREQLLEMVSGDYIIKVTGITSQLQKAEMLQNLVQFMNLIGQNPEAWVPYINQDKLLQRILEAFRPAIHDIEQIIADPETAMAKQAAQSTEAITPQLLTQMVQLVQMQQQQAQAAQQAELANQQAQLEAASTQQQMALREREMQHERQLAEMQARSAPTTSK